MGVREGGGSISKQHEKGANGLKKRSLKQGFIPSGGYWFEDSKVRSTQNGYGKNLNSVVAGMLTSMIGKNSEVGKGLRETNAHFNSTTGEILGQSSFRQISDMK